MASDRKPPVKPTQGCQRRLCFSDTHKNSQHGLRICRCIAFSRMVDYRTTFTGLPQLFGEAIGSQVYISYTMH